MTFLKEQLLLARVLPVLVVHSEEQAVALCRALQAGGLNAVEITLRTPAALAAIKAVKHTLPDLTVAAGTVITVGDMEDVAEAGVDFAVSPGLTRALSDCAQQLSLNFLPGVSTASEIMGGMELGHRVFKFFPAEASGGTKLLKAFESPFAGISFCPTGGINASNARSYADLGNVCCIGGSWMIEPEQLKNAQWAEISQSVRDCLLQLETGEK
ncbi:MAG: bifunctional 4-hydroxy-2-oxoglutarate aldolase/2-dehydro-3-deoxy-phosphogluconate aldolase [Gammaproteobacteria bacterium]|nr:bifunctional 4-hydroxy-2-oxoglutarate aldolase/2-dehydro-3-deoxy-phosphogluconate aldolase [Gammaproteobacteria bacterium]